MDNLIWNADREQASKWRNKNLTDLKCLVQILTSTFVTVQNILDSNAIDCTKNWNIGIQNSLLEP